MSNLESTRPGWIGRGISVGFILLAIGLTIWDLSLNQGHWFALLNVITLASGAATFHAGTIRIRRAREHHEFMEAHREFMDGHAGGAR